MSTDWSARTAAIEHFEKLVKQLKRVNDDDKEIYEAALHALRRSQDHTAIQTKLTETVRECERLKQLLATTLDGEEGIHVSTGGKKRNAKLFSALDVQAFTAIGFAIRKKHEAERAAKVITGDHIDALLRALSIDSAPPELTAMNHEAVRTWLIALGVSS